MKNDGTACQQTVTKSGFKHDDDGPQGTGRKNLDEKYINRGRDLVLGAEEDKEAELKKANRHKPGHPYAYTNSLIMSLAFIRSVLKLPYRQLEGFAEEMLGPENVPSFGHMRERINRLDVRIVDNFTLISSKPGMIRLVIDSSGLRQHNCGSWMAKKWKTKRGFVKIHFLIEVGTKKVLGLKVTDETVGDPTVFQELFDDVLKMLGPVPKVVLDWEDEEKARIGAIREAAKDDVDEVVTWAVKEAAGDAAVAVEVTEKAEVTEDTTPETANPEPQQNRKPLNPAAVRQVIKKIAMEAVSDITHNPSRIIYGDRAYATRTIVEAVDKAGFESGILAKKNSVDADKDADKDAGDTWSKTVCAQLGAGERNVASLSTEDKVANREEWKKMNGYGNRWIVEIVFAAFKRMFGESVSSLTKESIIREVRLKVAIYNRQIDKEMARAC